MGGFGGEDLVQQFFVDQIQDLTEVVGEEVKHMHVLRLKNGEEVYLSDGKKLVKGILEDLQKTRAKFRVICEVPSSEPPYEITLFQGLPKADKLDLIVQKAVELGVAKIVPVQTSRSIVKWDDTKALNKVNRLNRIAQEAAKQSHRVILPIVEMPVSWPVFLERWFKEEGLKLVFWEEGSSNLVQAFVETPKKVAVFIGPEGALSKDEVDKLQVLTYTLGPRILRTETAGIVALAHLMFGLEMKGENYI